ncbi:hypothetical protein PoB_002314800 [Plakobranchus ocellatus]|uniref:Uncharacterized protein n=1 Tax=Plakobranchus ocellatus TaxID=259542 RepID=A0AAV3ZQ02_9GAST|nr:hypothetical protein PoB_002314800 [Plakobranchus ocellatus]
MKTKGLQIATREVKNVIGCKVQDVENLRHMSSYSSKTMFHQQCSAHFFSDTVDKRRIKETIRYVNSNDDHPFTTTFVEERAFSISNSIPCRRTSALMLLLATP